MSEIAYKLIVNIVRSGIIIKEYEEYVAFRLWISLYVFLMGWNVKGIYKKRPTQDFFCRLILVISSLSYQMEQASSIRDTQGKKELERVEVECHSDFDR